MSETKAVGEWVLVKVPEETTTKSGIVVPKGATSKYSAVDAEVISIGPDAFATDGPVKSAQFAVGDKVKVHKQLLLKLEEELYFIKPNGILGAVK